MAHDLGKPLKNIILGMEQGGTPSLHGWWFSLYLVALGQDGVSGFGGSEGCLMDAHFSQGQLDWRSSVQDRPSLLRVPAELWGQLPEQPLLQRYLLGAWGTSGAGGKAGANIWNLLIGASHSFVPLLISHPQYWEKWEIVSH